MLRGKALSTMSSSPTMASRLAGRVLGYRREILGFGLGAVTFCPVLTGDDFFEHKFTTNKNPDDIIDFYSTEDFLQILGIFPLAIHFVLAGVQWDLEKENTMAVHNAMEISFTLEEREEQAEDGSTVVAFFQKRERFKNFVPLTRFLLWDQVQCYGYNRKGDGTVEVFHRGEFFNGPFPVRLLVMLHSRYVIWATEKHINSPAFGSATLEAQEEQRSNIPLHAVKDFFRRLSLAHQIAMESGKIAATSSIDESERTLKKLQRLQESPTDLYVTTLRKANLKRRMSTLGVADHETQAAIDAAMKSLSQSKEGKDAATAAVQELMAQSKPKVEEMPTRYGGAFAGKQLKGMPEGQSM